MGTAYTAYVLDDASREMLLETFTPKYADVIAHHITHKFGATEVDVPKQPQDVKVVGFHDNGAIQALVVEVDGAREQLTDNDKRYFHITFTLDRAQGVSPKDSNPMLRKIAAEKGEGALANLREPISIHVTPQLLKHADKKPDAAQKSHFLPPKP